MVIRGLFNRFWLQRLSITLLIALIEDELALISTRINLTSEVEASEPLHKSPLGDEI